MSEKQYLEQLKTLKVTPPEFVWAKIQSELDRRKALPWYKSLSQTQVAILALGFLSSLVTSILLFNNIDNPISNSLEINDPINFTTEEPPTIIKKSILNQKPLEHCSMVTLANENKIVAPSKPSNIVKKSQSSSQNQVNERSSSKITTSKNEPTLETAFAEISKEVKSSEQVAAEPQKPIKKQDPKRNIPTENLEIVNPTQPPLVENQIPKEEKIILNPISISKPSKIQTGNIENVVASNINSPKIDVPINWSQEPEKVINFIENNPIAQPENETYKLYVLPYLAANYMKIGYNGKAKNPYFSENASFKGNVGYNFGFNFGYQFNNHWSIETGIGNGQYIQKFKEDKSSNLVRSGIMYIDQLEIPLMGRYSFLFGSQNFKQSLSLKAGLLYGSVYRYQVNYSDLNVSTNVEKSYHVEADKRQYNSLQLGYIAGLDYDAYLSKFISLNLSAIGSVVSQIQNFPSFKGDKERPKQTSAVFSVGVKFHF